MQASNTKKCTSIRQELTSQLVPVINQATANQHSVAIDLDKNIDRADSTVQNNRAHSPRFTSRLHSFALLFVLFVNTDIKAKRVKKINVPHSLWENDIHKLTDKNKHTRKRSGICKHFS